MPSLENALCFSAPAKINLDLRIVGRREDGYHLLQSHVTFLSWQDLIFFKKIEEGIQFSCSSDLGKADDNLALRAARRMAELAPHVGGVAIHLEKNLPVAAGLGGGSSDAATVMLVLNRLWQVGLTHQQLIDEGVALGADVPVFLGQQTCLMEGIGEKLTPVDLGPPWSVLLLNPRVPLVTKEVFRAYREGLTSSEGAINIFNLPRGKRVVNPLVNDLQPVSQVLAPVVGEMVQALQANGAWLAAMSGSGPTVFGLFEDGPMAAKAAEAITNSHGHWLLFHGITCKQHPFEQEWRRQFASP
ncbi:MAG: 4-(cytidine 5'-diphospho)-2-C-methyl-D-erythritol kinase [Magnetococcales bacterium]|nr:4-(cytidine 5'-diphospho)-2-C-methyl-D-erythritol kinase [Magnetococcales bacterium]NGZ25549.1 4-(cytidine 5'-diphospho)-2-C-methyl-D-erythritol kinase [Magnetococcales bacterium]